MVRGGLRRRGTKPRARARRQAHERRAPVWGFHRDGGRRIPRDGHPLARERWRHLGSTEPLRRERGRPLGAGRARRGRGALPTRGHVLGRPPRADCRPLRPQMGPRPARARRSARGDRPGCGRGIWQLGSLAGCVTGSPPTEFHRKVGPKSRRRFEIARSSVLRHLQVPSAERRRCTMDLETLLVSLYVFVEDWWQQHHPPVPRRPGRPHSLSPSEVLTLAVLSQWPRWRSERDFYRFAEAHLCAYFPHLLSHGQLNRRIRALEPEMRALQQDLPTLLADVQRSTTCWTPP